MPRRTSPSRNTDQPTAPAPKPAKKLLKSCPTHSWGPGSRRTAPGGISGRSAPEARSPVRSDPPRPVLVAAGSKPAPAWMSFPRRFRARARVRGTPRFEDTP